MLMAAAVVILSDTTPSMFIQDISIEIFYAGTVITPLPTHTKNKDKKNVIITFRYKKNETAEFLLQ